MGKDLVTVTLYRENSSETWGFRLAGGRGTGQPLTVSQVSKDSLAAKVGLTAHDNLVSIAGREVTNMSHIEAEKVVQDAGNNFQMVIQRDSECEGRKISYEQSAMTVSLKLGGGTGAPSVAKEAEAFISNVPVSDETPSLLGDSVDFAKSEKKPADIPMQPADMSKTYNRKDWNCPWVRKDGRGLKQAIRAVDEVLAPAKTSIQHYYSEPKSILGNEPMLSPEELQEIIRQHGAESRPSSSAQVTNGGAHYEAEMEADIQQELMHREMNNSQQQMEYSSKKMAEYSANQMNNNMEESQNNYYSEREVDSQAPPDLEPVTPVPATTEMVGEQGCYEPSADELIDVLKNLENLAAANPVLYKSIVGQIKDSQQYSEQAYYEQQQQQYYQQSAEHMTNGSASEQQLQFEQQQMQFQQESARYEQETVSYEQEAARYEQEMYSQSEQQMCQEERYEAVQTQSTQETVVEERRVEESEEEMKMRVKMERLEKEANEQVRVALQKQREQKIQKQRQLENQKPKEITVIAGDGKAVKILLGGEKDTEDNRKQVAEAAGLKHIPLPDFDDCGSAWAGSLKKTERCKVLPSRDDKNEGGSPWAGSLRHVKERPKRAPRKDDDDMYGTAPWMGTLRHVVHDNKVTKQYGVNQFQSKRYPDEDATNPFEGAAGSHARPVFPLTPAAIINGCAMSRSEMAMKEDREEVDRIRGHIKSETVSSALLKALMPKLLKMHESKYPAMDRDEASKIMEEILAMQVGLNVDQQADANEEAEMIIRAIMQDEVGKHVYSKMADDLEAAAQRRKKEGKGKKKVKKTKKEAPAVVESAA